MERKLKPIVVQQRLSEKRLSLFTPEEFRRLFNVTLRAAQEFIKDHKHDVFIKLRNGLYTLRSAPPNEFEIANHLYGPSYVSLEYALSYYGLIPETVYTMTSITTRVTREFIVQNISYSYSRIKKKAYTGYQLSKVGQTKVLIATPEKALVDYLYFVNLQHKTLNDRLRTKGILKKEVFRYARLFERPRLIDLIRGIL